MSGRHAWPYSEQIEVQQTERRRGYVPRHALAVEPAGLGAVVIDGRHHRWVRLGFVKRPWINTDAPVNPCMWDEIRDVVHVLSPGVTP